MSTPTITLEEHCVVPSLAGGKGLPASFASSYSMLTSRWIDKLLDVAPSGPRADSMDANGVDIQVLSNIFTSSCEPAITTAANDELAAAASCAPDRYRAFASLPMCHPREAVLELRRCVGELGFVGALLDSHLLDGRYYDDPGFDPVFAAAEELGCPVYLHPMSPTPAVQETLYDGEHYHGGDNEVGKMLGIAGWGWHCDTALCVLRMYGAGVFERFPSLKVVIGHMGEMLPFMLERIDEKFIPLLGGVLRQTFQQTWDRNVWVTTSGMFSLAPMACLLRSTKPDRILYSVDYPYSHESQGAKFLADLKKSGMVSEEDFEKIRSRNAMDLMSIKA